MRIHIFFVVGLIIVLGAVPVFAQNISDTSELASLLQSLQNMVRDLTAQVQSYMPAAVVSPAITDINKDGLNDDADWNYMRSRWFSNDVSADINGDGIVNSIDFGLLNRNWNKNS
jgi:hypothetical protein